MTTTDLRARIDELLALGERTRKDDAGAALEIVERIRTLFATDPAAAGRARGHRIDALEAYCHVRFGRMHQAEAIARRILEDTAAECALPRAEALRVLCSVHSKRRELDEAAGRLRAAIEIAQEHELDPEFEGTLHHLHGLVLQNGGRAAESRPSFQRALDMFTPDSHASSSTRVALATTFAMLGDFESALEHYRRALEGMRELGRRRDLAWIQFYVGSTLCELDHPREALDAFEACREIIEESGRAEDITWSFLRRHYWMGRGQAEMLAGNLDEAATLLRLAADDALEADDGPRSSQSLAWLGEAYLRSGKYDEAAVELQRALDESMRYPKPSAKVDALLGLAKLRAEDRIPGCWEETLREALETAANAQHAVVRVTAHERACALYASQRRFEEALEQHERFYESRAELNRVVVAARIGRLTQDHELERNRFRADEERRLRRLLKEEVAKRTGELEQANRNLQEEIRERERAEKERSEIEALLWQVQKAEAIDRLAAGIAHDMNNMLAVILGFGDMAMQDVAAGRELPSETLGEILGAAERGSRLTRQLLSFSRRQPREERRIELRTLVQELLPMLRRLLPEAVRVELDPCPVATQVVGDWNQLEQVLVNLAINARDAMDGRGRIKLGAVAEGGVAALFVEDDGPGIPEDLRERVLEPFYTTKTTGRGTGLGLSVAAGIARQHRGELVIGAAPGGGARVELRLPEATEVDASPELSATPETVGRESRPLRVLVVEDDDRVRALIATMVADLGHRAVQACDVDSALRCLEERGDELDLVLSDVIMPGRTGLELLAIVRERWPRLRFVLTSGCPAEEAGSFGLPAGCRFLAKPFRSRGLAEVLREDGPDRVTDGG